MSAEGSLEADEILQIVGAVIFLEVIRRFLDGFPGYGTRTILAVGLFRLLQIAAMLAMTRKLFARPWTAAGLPSRDRAPRDAIAGIGAALAAGAGILAYRAATLAQGGEDLFDQLGLRAAPIADSEAPLWANALVMGALGPLAEDLFFWGLLYGSMRPRVGPGWSFFAVAVPYVLLHWQGHWMALVEPAVGGICFWLLFEWRRSILATVPLHAAGNLGILLVNRGVLFAP